MEAVEAAMAQVNGRILAELSDFDWVADHAAMAILRGVSHVQRSQAHDDVETAHEPVEDDRNIDEPDATLDSPYCSWVRAMLNRMPSWEAGGQGQTLALPPLARANAPSTKRAAANIYAVEGRQSLDTRAEPTHRTSRAAPNAASVTRVHPQRRLSPPERGQWEAVGRAAATARPVGSVPVEPAAERPVLDDTQEGNFVMGDVDNGDLDQGGMNAPERHSVVDDEVVDFGFIDLNHFTALDVELQSDTDGDELAPASRVPPLHRPVTQHLREGSSRPVVDDADKDLEERGLEDGEDQGDGGLEDENLDGDLEDEELEEDQEDEYLDEEEDWEDDQPEADRHEYPDEEVLASGEQDGCLDSSEYWEEQSDVPHRHYQEETEVAQKHQGHHEPNDENDNQSEQASPSARSADPAWEVTRPVPEPLAVLVDNHQSPLPSIPASPVQTPPLHSPERSPSPPQAHRRRTERIEGSRPGARSATSSSAATGRSNRQSARHPSAGQVVEQRNRHSPEPKAWVHPHESPTQVDDDMGLQPDTMPAGGRRIRQRQLAALAPFLVQNEEWEGTRPVSTGDKSACVLGWPLLAAESVDSDEQDGRGKTAYEAVAAMDTIDLTPTRPLEEWVLSLKKNSNPNRIGDVRKLVREVPHTVAAVSDVYSQLLPEAATAWQASQGWVEEVGDDADLVLDYARRHDDAEKGRDEAELLLEWLNQDDEGEERQERLAANMRELAKKYRTDMLPRNLVDAIGHLGTDNRGNSNGECQGGGEEEGMDEDMEVE